MKNVISTQQNDPDNGFIYNGSEDNSFNNVSYSNHRSDTEQEIYLSNDKKS